ncbi:MAG: DNA ligase D [Phycisphaeraceae bacterium]|nr:DNA ligase D [Phycisphaeraceae bacterium]
MSLKQYVRKRNFTKTSEPRGKPRSTVKKKSVLGFVVQKHDASRLHYDFRLELGGVLKSWAVPKGPSLDPAEKRLAVEVEDHPIEYGEFEGVIPYGEYGGGTVMLWDRGTWEPIDPDPAAALRKGKLTFALHGKRLKGEWTLARMGGRAAGEKKHNWLLIKKDDRHASHGKKELVSRARTSIKSKRNLDEIARAGGQKRKRRSEGDDDDAELPRGISPQLCTLSEHVPTGENWLHEIKFDGYRLIAQLRRGAVRLITRAGKDWTSKFRPIAHAIELLPCSTAVLDGEAVIVDEAGKTHFQSLQQAIKERKFANLAFFLFDLLFLDGDDLRSCPLNERKAVLKKLLARSKAGRVLRYSDHVTGSGETVQQQACRLGLEGVVSKQADAPYTSGRSRSWLKIKCGRRQEFVIVGYTAPGGARKHFGSLLLGAHDQQGKLVYTGKVGTGFSDSTLRDLGARLQSLRTDHAALNGSVPRADARGATWVKPELVGEVAFTEWTQDGRLRHPSFEGLREDKPAGKVRIEAPAKDLAEAVGMTKSKVASKARRSPRISARRSAKARRSRAAKGDSVVAGITITHPDRVIYPDCGVTKLDLARYYEKVADRMLPFIADRPLSVVRCVRGTGDQCFFQKHIGDTFGPPVKSIRVRKKSGSADYLAVDSVAGLVTLAQMGVIEIHPWGSSAEDLEHPDVLIFDLDPGENVAFGRIKAAAREIRTLLKRDGLESFVKTSGGKGLHIQAPLDASATWDEAKDYAGRIARALASDRPHEYVAIMTKSRRRGKIFVDYLRNGRGATSVAPYSARARKGAPISMPISWTKLASLESAAEFTLLEGLETQNPWRGYFDLTQQLP